MAEKEYIERGALNDILEARAKMAIGTPVKVYYSAASMAQKLPAADVVEVVRCKDCMHFCEIIGVTSYCSNRYGLNGKIHCDDFCSYGERKNEK